MTDILYFDNAATTAMSKQALDTYVSVATNYRGNPSALHKEGLQAKTLLQEKRESIAKLLGVSAANLIFTSGATEANALVLNNLIWSPQSGHAILTNIEHPSVKEYGRLLRQLGWTITYLNAPHGFIRIEDLQEALTEKTRLVSCMLVNNVVGSIQNIGSLVSLVRDYQKKTNRKIHFHTDAVQALGKISFSLTELGVDSASFSAHKFKGPQGVGMLYNTNPGLQPLSRGGHQENGLRPGTENLAGIAAMDSALEEAFAHFEENSQRVEKINRFLRSELSFLPILSPSEQTSPYILTFSVAPFPSEVFTRMLYDRGFCVSSGSACSNNAKQKGEGVLTSMLFSSEEVKSSLRLSFGYDTTFAEAESLSSAIKTIYRELT